MKKIILFLIFSFPVCAQISTEADYSHPEYLSFRWDNDFVNQTDRYFTNGMAFTYMGKWLKDSPINYIFPKIYDKGRNYYSLSLVQNIYTPSDFSVPDIKKYDRPFAGYLLLGEAKEMFFPSRKFYAYFNFQFGFIGKNSFAEDMQNGIHDLLPPSGHVLGWDTQIGDGLLVNYSFDFEKNIFSVNGFQTNWFAGGKLGVPYTQSGAGLKLLYSSSGDYFTTPALSKDGEFEYQFFTRANLNLVLYDATFEGGIYSNSVFTISEINNLVFEFEISGKAAYGKTELSFGYIYTTPQANLMMHHRWGYLEIRYKF